MPTTRSVRPDEKPATPFGALADEAIAIVQSNPYLEAREKISALLDSVRHIALQDGERRGIERGAEIAAKTTTLLLQKLYGRE